MITVSWLQILWLPSFLLRLSVKKSAGRDNALAVSPYEFLGTLFAWFGSRDTNCLITVFSLCVYRFMPAFKTYSKIVSSNKDSTEGIYLVQIITSWKSMWTTTKKSSTFIKKIIHVDDMMIHNIIKYLVQTRLRLWDIKRTNFKPESCPADLFDNFLAWNLLFLYLTNEVEFGQDILQSCVSSFHLHVWFFGEFRRLFYCGLHEFSRRLWFALDTFPDREHIW